MNQDGTQQVTLNHMGRHELLDFFEPRFNDDPNLVAFTGATKISDGLFQITENPAEPGQYLMISSPEFTTHASGDIIRMQAEPGIPADAIVLEQLNADNTGFYRHPLALSNGDLISSHANDNQFLFLLKELQQNGPNWSTNQRLTSLQGGLWELSPVEVKTRPRPTVLPMDPQLPNIEKQIFNEEGVDIQSFKQYLEDSNLALVVSRNVTTRDNADRQQPFNLRIADSTTQTLGSAGKIYDLSDIQFLQADHIRSGTYSKPGRRPLAQFMHDSAAIANNPPTNGPQGSVKLGNDGSMAAFIPAGRAMTWQTLAPDGSPVVRERIWVTFQPGEIRACTSCHGLNTVDQTGNFGPTNPPEALRTLLHFWKQNNGGQNTENKPPIVSPITTNIIDVDPASSGIQFYEETSTLILVLQMTLMETLFHGSGFILLMAALKFHFHQGTEPSQMQPLLIR